jgi:hypothetical protein
VDAALFGLSDARGAPYAVAGWARMSIGEFFKRLFTSTPVRPDYTHYPDERLIELWSERSDLTDEAVELLQAEAARRALVLPTETKPARKEPSPRPHVRKKKRSSPAGGPGSIVFFPIMPDGSQTIALGGQKVVFNEPVRSGADCPRIDDPRRVAHEIVQAHRSEPIGEHAELVFVEACWLVAGERRGDDLRDPRRRALLEAVRAAGERDAERCLRELTGTRAARDLRSRWAEALLVRHCERELEAACVHGEVDPGLCVIERAARRDPEACASLLETVTSESKLSFALHAAIAALDVGHHVPESVLRVWRSAEDTAWEREDHAWLNGEVQRLSRIDVEQAVSLWTRINDEFGADANASEALFLFLARRDPERAVALVGSQGEALGVDAMPRIVGAILGGADVRGPLEARLAELNAYAHSPAWLFAQLVEAFALLEDVEGVGRVLERGGAAPWQVAVALRDPVAALVRRGSGVVAELVERATSYDVAPGVVAGRDASAGALHLGAVQLRPPWLAFDEPRPLDTLRILPELREDGPQWGPETRC